MPQKDEKLYKQQVKKKAIEKRKNLLEQKENNIKIEENKKKRNNVTKSNFFLEALGLTEEEMQNNSEQIIQKEKQKQKNDKDINNNIQISNSKNKININNFLSDIKKDKIPKYYNYKVSKDDIYIKILSFDFYNTKLKTEIIPNYFENELHYRYIWIPNFLNELK